MSESIFITFILSPSYRELPGRHRWHQPFHFLHNHGHEGKVQNRGFAFWGLRAKCYKFLIALCLDS